MKYLDKKSIWVFLLQYLGVLPVAVVLITAGLTGAFVDMTEGRYNFSTADLVYPIIFLIVWVAISCLAAWLTWLNYRYEVSEQGFKKESGIIWKRYVTIPYSRIQNVDIHRGILARIFGLSDLQIQTAGNSNNMGMSEGRLPGISKAEAEILRDELIRRISEPASKQGL